MVFVASIFLRFFASGPTSTLPEGWNETTLGISTSP